MGLSVLERENHCDPVVSVIVPVLNTKPYLAQCLDSLLAQTLREIEIICVDNGSTDGSYELLGAYARDHANITVMRHPEGRQGEARNAGIERARGRYVGFVDSDDFVSSDMFRVLCEAAQAGGADIAICNMQLYYEGNGHGPCALPGDLLAVAEPFSIEQRPRLLRNLTICNKLFSRELIERYELRFPKGVFHEDQFFVIAALALAKSIVTIPSPLYSYRRGRPGSVNEYRGRDSMHIYRVMELVSDFAQTQAVAESLMSLIKEVQVLKYLQIYRLTGKEFQREYFHRMKSELQAIALRADVRILSSSERRESQVVQRYGHTQYRLFLLLRSIYGALRNALLTLTC